MELFHQNNSNKKRMIILKDWLPHQKKIIKMVQNYPIIYHPVPTDKMRHKKKLKIAWNEIILKLDSSRKSCRAEWNKIYLKYAKLMMLVNAGTISMEVVSSCSETRRFLDGSLSFLDPYLSDETYLKIPFYIHKSINTIFGLPILPCQSESGKYNPNIVTHEQIKTLLRHRDDCLDSFDEVYLLPIVESAIQCKLSKLLQEKTNTMKKDVAKTSKKTNLGLESELIIEDNIKLETQDEDDTVEQNLTLNTNTVLKDDNLEHILPDIQTSNKAEIDDTIIITDNTKHTTVSDYNELIGTVSDDYMRKFFNDLGKTMSAELSLKKQNLLKLRINELLRNILEGN